MKAKKEASFIKGALILAAASIIVKIIGAVFRIPLTNLVGSYAMGLYSTAYRYYSILLTVATAGFPIAISKMISESRALGRYKESKKIFKSALSLCFIIGLVGMLALIFGAGALSRATNDENAAISIIALAPAVLFMSCTAAFRGFFQGHSNMTPTALSQILEALCRLLFGLFLAWFFLSRGFAEKYIAAGTISGITIGTALTVLLMLFLAVLKKRKDSEELDECGKERTSGRIVKDILKLAVPVTLGSLVMNLTSAIDMFLITNRLAVIGYTSEQTTSLFGIYDNYALPLFNLIPSIIISLNVSVTPTISAAYARGDKEGLSKALLTALRIVVIFTLPAAVGVSVLSEPILSVLYKSAADVSIAAPVLSVLGLASFFLCASSLTSTVLQAMGKPTVPLITMLCGAVIKIVANYVLISIPGVELIGAAVGTILCYIAITVINMVYIAKKVGFKPPFVRTYVKPLAGCAIMGVIVFFAYSVASKFLPGIIAVGGAVVLGAAAYFVSLLLLGGIEREDVLGLPKGEKMAKLLFRK